MRFIAKILILFSCLLSVNCNSNVESKDSKNQTNTKNVTEYEGHFDLKSICLNLHSRPKRNENVCEAPLSKTLETNSETIWVILEICNNERENNCIEPFADPNNAPPETIQIRDNGSNLITSLAKVRVKLTGKKNGDKQNKPLVTEI